MFYNDQETEVDLLYHEAVARTVVNLIKARPKVPITVGVHGDWGAGKSSVLKMTAAAFERDESTLCVWFNGWTFEGFADAKTVVIETIVEELRRKRPTSKKVQDAAAKVLKRIDWLKVAKKTGGFAFTAFTGIPTFDQIQSVIDGVKGSLAKPEDTLSLDDAKAFAEQAKDLLKEGKQEQDSVPKQMHRFREEFEELVEAADIDRLVVIVDDLDRCLPETAIATLEAIRLFLFVPNTAFVIGADEVMIEYAVKKHFPDLPAGTGSVTYARSYLEKLIQVPFRIPALGPTETQIYVLLLQVESDLGADHAAFKKLLKGAQEELRRPWQSNGLDDAAIAKYLEGTEMPDEVRRAAIISRHTSRILTEGTRGNPRQIKRFLNSLALRSAIAKERQFDADILLPALAKVMLAESFSPELYAQFARLAVASTDGKVKALAQLEAPKATPQVAEKEKPDKGKSAPSPEPNEPEFDDWSRSEWIKSWAAIAPALGCLDLRPYVFATRDKRGYLGGFGAASHLESLVDKLLGPKASVMTLTPEVSKLAGPDAEQTFELLRARTLLSESFLREPPGVQGLMLLVTHHASLQRRLVSLLKELPTPKLGVWAASYFGSLIKDESVKPEFDQVLDSWQGQSENTLLKSAVTQMRTIPKG
ncbi:MAG: NTPase KAP [Comamonadaceae bacterium]|nr:MAG: NTPase KAP [Comamonadaceae bacterium]